MNTQAINTSTTITPSGSLVTGLFPDRSSAEAAYQRAHDRGYTRDDVNLLMSDETRKVHFSHDATIIETELGSKAAEGGFVAIVAVRVGVQRASGQLRNLRG